MSELWQLPASELRGKIAEKEISPLDLTKAETFPNRGQITVSSGVTSGTSLPLAGSTVFKITAGGKRIVAE